MVTEILILLATLLLLIYIFNWVRLSSDLPPGPPRYPLVGSLPGLINGSVPIHKTITETAKKYGDVLTVYFPTGKGCQPYVVINSFETAHNALGVQDPYKDTAVLLNIWAINHDERHWENPHQFNPDRFLDSEGHFTGTKKMSYMPFGAGRRVCIGEALAKTELFLISATLLQKFKFETPPGCSPPDLSKGILGITWAPLPFKVTASKRYIKC